MTTTKGVNIMVNKKKSLKVDPEKTILTKTNLVDTETENINKQLKQVHVQSNGLMCYI